jgi:uncharacterized protein YeaO (DUF488 family)
MGFRSRGGPGYALNRNNKVALDGDAQLGCCRHPLLRASFNPDHVNIRIKRVYEPQSPDDGKRILVDRLWPRGLSKEKAGVDLWLKDIAPSTELRKWFGHDPAKWTEFQKRYRAEEKENAEPLTALKREAKAGLVTLLFGAKDEEHNEAIILQSILKV